MPRQGVLSKFFASKFGERNKTAPPPKHNSDTQDLSRLVWLFPDIDRNYALLCLQQYTHNRVAAVSEKLLDRNFGNYPKFNFSESHEDRNALLEHLNALFPEHDVRELRESLSTQSYSNLYRAIDDLLLREKENDKKTEEDRVTLRTRIGLDMGIIEPRQKFRSDLYASAVFARMQLLFAQYRDPRKIRAVCLEHNFDYEPTKETLTRVFAKTSQFRKWLGFFHRESKEYAEKQLLEHPSSDCQELDEEIAAIEGRRLKEERAIQIQNDIILAQRINEEEYTEADEMVECGCCFGEYTWEDMVSCNDGHLVCRNCVTHTAEECAFGQGNNSYEPRGLRCIAATTEKCESVIPTRTLERILSSDLRMKYTERITATELDSSQVNLVRCPFCIYAEFKEPPSRIRLRFFCRYITAAFLFLITLIHPLILANITIPLMIMIVYTDLLQWKAWDTAVNDAHERRDTEVLAGARKFKCLNEPECGRESCLECGKGWTSFHDCLEDEKDGLRLYVEKAMADAIKRTCPQCNVGFIKADGCNLMHCRCGFVMCYICRQDVEAESYGHFCQHFRPLGGPCKLCESCGLYDKEDEEEAVQQARRRATQEYLVRHPNAANVVLAAVREAKWSRPPKGIAPVIAQENSILDTIVDFIMEYGNDLCFERYTSG